MRSSSQCPNGQHHPCAGVVTHHVQHVVVGLLYPRASFDRAPGLRHDACVGGAFAVGGREGHHLEAALIGSSRLTRKCVRRARWHLDRHSVRQRN